MIVFNSILMHPIRWFNTSIFNVIEQTKFSKNYADEKEELFRRQLWEATVVRNAIHNQEYLEGKHTYTVGENQFADMVRFWCASCFAKSLGSHKNMFCYNF